MKIDLDRVHAELEVLDRESLLSLALALLEAVPKTRQGKVLERYLPLGRITTVPARASEVRAEVQRFHAHAVAGEYFEDFNVNSRNYMDKSAGTRGFIAEYNRLAQRTAKIAAGGAHGEACEAFDLLVDLHRRIDDGEDVIFLADEHGAWQIGCPWEDHLPHWFASIAATLPEPSEFAQAVLGAIQQTAPYKPAVMLTAARRVASPTQKRALRGAKVR